MRLAHQPWDEAEAPQEAELRRRLEREGFTVLAWSDPAGRVYDAHEHPHDESLWGVHGEIVFTVAGTDYRLGPGDRILLPGGTVHAARVGADGARFLVGQR